MGLRRAAASLIVFMGITGMTPAGAAGAPKSDTEVFAEVIEGLQKQGYVLTGHSRDAVLSRLKAGERSIQVLIGVALEDNQKTCATQREYDGPTARNSKTLGVCLDDPLGGRSK